MASKPPKAVLFDIGGVVVRSPMQAIHDYEAAHSIPHNWVNFAIAQSSARPTGAWARLETGTVPLDAAFFRDFHADLHDFAAWRAFCTQYAAKQSSSSSSSSSSSAPPSQSAPLPPLPQVDSTSLFWAMMIISRSADPAMSAALAALQASGRFVVAALSNTVAFPAWHPFGAPAAADDVRARFDVFVSSAHAGVRKPHPEAYTVALVEINKWCRANGKGSVVAGEVVFLDDIGQNLRTAREMGFRTIKVDLGKTAKAVGELEGMTGLNLSGKGDAKL